MPKNRSFAQGEMWTAIVIYYCSCFVLSPLGLFPLSFFYSLFLTSRSYYIVRWPWFCHGKIRVQNTGKQEV